MSTATLDRPLAEAAVGGARTTGRVVAYSRISRFRETVGTATVEVTRGVDRQDEDSIRCAVEYGLGAVDEFYTDNDRSASEYATKARERFQDLLEDVAAGRVGVILVWVLDRIVRDPRDLEILIGLCRAHGVRLIQTASGTELDPGNPESVLHARISGAVAAYEAAKASMRQLRRLEAAMAKGLPHGGRRRFGYEPGMTEVRESEAAYVREAATRFLAGETLGSLAAWLNTEGVPTPSTEYRQAAGKAPAKWTGPNLRQLLGGPHLAGLRTHGKAAVGGARTVVGKGTWPAILPTETHEQIVAILANPARRTNGGSNVRKWLLSGLATCAGCGAPVRPGSATKRGLPTAYRCPTGRHVSRPVERVDYVVESAVVKRLTKYAGGILVDGEAAAEVARLRDARAALDDRMADYVDAVATMAPAAYAAATNRLAADMEALDARIGAASVAVTRASRVLDGVTGPDAAEVWAALPLSRRRAVIAEVCTVELRGGKHNTTPRGTVFNPDDVVIRWA